MLGPKYVLFYGIACSLKMFSHFVVEMCEGFPCFCKTSRFWVKLTIQIFREYTPTNSLAHCAALIRNESGPVFLGKTMALWSLFFIRAKLTTFWKMLSVNAEYFSKLRNSETAHNALYCFL